MKKIYLSVILAGVAMLTSAQNKIDLVGQGLIKQQAFIEKLGDKALLTNDKEENHTLQPFGKDVERIVVLVDLEEDADIAELEATGAIIRSKIDNLALVEVDYDKVIEFSNLKSIKTLSMPKMTKSKMDQARAKTGVNTVHRPLGQLTQAYKGKGVVAGIVDVGVTANHPNFMNTDGSSRVKSAWTIAGQNGSVTAYNTEDKLKQFTTDVSTATHGTHVSGIMAGSYKNLADTINYYGVASEADILLVGLGNSAYDSNILLGFEEIIGYAEENDQPCVVNLSMGSSNGPHDGTDLFSQYMDKLAERAVVCVAAGNEADMGIAITKTCTEADKNVNTFLMPLTAQGQTGTIEVWSNTNQEFKVTPVLYDLTTMALVYKLPTISSSTNGKLQYVSTTNAADAGDVTSAFFDEAYNNSWVGYGSKVDAYNNRYTMSMQYYLLLNTVTNPKGNVVFGLMVEGNAGQRIDVYCTSQYTTLASNNIPGWIAGGGDGSITDVSCCKNVISVGAYSTRNSCPVRVNGYMYNFAQYFAVDDIAEFSSYATLVDGRQLPHFAAPGEVVVSSMSPYYMTLALQQGVYENEFMLVGKTMYNKKDYYYDYMQGTSMASPFAAGTVALMLQANPDLTSAEVRDILIETATKDDKVNKAKIPIQWGAGKINVLDAVKKAVEYGAGVEDVVADKNVFVSTIAQNQYEVTYIGATSVNAVLYSIAGQAVVNVSAQGETAVVDASSIASGVYVLAVEADGAKYTTKVVVK